MEPFLKCAVLEVLGVAGAILEFKLALSKLTSCSN